MWLWGGEQGEMRAQMGIWEFDLGVHGCSPAGREGQDLSKGACPGDAGALGVIRPGPNWDRTQQTGHPGPGLTVGKAEIKGIKASR